MNIQNLSISGKVLVVIGVFAMFSILSAAFSTGKVRDIAGRYGASIDQQGRTALFGSRGNRALGSMHAAVAELELSTTDEGNRKAFAQIETAKASFQRFMDLAMEGDPEATSTLKSIEAQGLEIVDVTCKPAIEMGLKATDAADVAASQAEYYGKCGPAFDDLAKRLTKTVDDAVLAQSAITNDLAAASHETILATYAVSLIEVLAATTFGIFAIRAWVSGPVKRLADTTRRLAGGDLTVTVLGTDRKDEIGLMAAAVQVFKDNGNTLREAELHGKARRRSAAEEEALRDAARAAAASQQAHVVETLANGLEKLADGGLVFRITENLAPEYEKLRTDFNSAMQKLQGAMAEISTNTVAIRSGTGEISSAADDLARRTEQQAASLEQTAAALDQITATVRKTAEGSRHAQDVVGAAKRDAEQSGQVVRQAIEAMSGIERASDQIGNIIGVIDEIAFQTNLLALNAGVEAARAGEAGRGFAVVASEVRALAQRSAEAAKDIKTLISTSSAQVEQGVDLVGQTGKSLERIVDQVAEITAIVSDIAASAQEQASGLDQVNIAVNQMDQVTQQNAAMVEESTAASHALAKETEELSRLIASFKLGGHVAREAKPAGVAPRQRTARALGTMTRGGAAAA